MISIIICSRNRELLSNISNSIEETIGVQFEIISINNEVGRYGICEAYNLGATQSKYEYLCFMHKDISFKTINWGAKAIDHIESDINAGVLGVAGSTFKTMMVSSWWQPDIYDIEPKRLNLIQHYKYNKVEKAQLLSNPLDETKSQVASLDGVFLFVKRKVWAKTKFDQKLLKGFHGYDLDFTLSVGRKFNNYVVFDINIEHFSEGTNDIDWFLQNLLVHNKFFNILPIRKYEELNERMIIAAEIRNLQYCIDFFEILRNNRTKLILFLIKFALRYQMLKIYKYSLKSLYKIILDNRLST